MSIELRQKIKDNSVFLVTQDQKVIAQLHLSQKLLKYLPEVDLASFPFMEFTPASRMETLERSDLQIKDIDARVRCVNLKVKVVGKSIPKFREDLATPMILNVRKQIRKEPRTSGHVSGL